MRGLSRRRGIPETLLRPWEPSYYRPAMPIDNKLRIIVGNAPGARSMLTAPGTQLTAPKGEPSALLAQWALPSRGTAWIVASRIRAALKAHRKVAPSPETAGGAP